MSITGKALFLANSGEYLGKRTYFYPFKDNFLRQYGKPDGWDRQRIIKYCYSCQYGCPRCMDGIYDVATYWLERFMVDGSVYHIPTRVPPALGTLIRNEFTGRIEHVFVNDRIAYFAAILLFLRYDRSRLWAWFNAQCSEVCCHPKWKWWQAKGFLRRKADLNDETIPF